MARGRPRTENIPRFNVDTFLTDNQKFLRFKRVGKLSTKDAWTYLTRFWSFVAANYARKQNLSDMDRISLAEYCWWDRGEDELWKLLTESGFVDPDGMVHDWTKHQPLVEDSIEKREVRKDKPELVPDKIKLERDKRDLVPSNEMKLNEIELNRTKKKERVKEKPNLPPRLETDLKTWNQNRGDWPKCEDVPKHLIREHKACCLDTEFDLKAVMTKAQQSSFLAGKKFVTLFWMLKPDKTSGVRNYRRILNGEFDDPEQPTTQPKESQSDKAARQAEARARSDRILALSRGEKETP